MSEHPVTADETLDAAHKFLGDDYVEKGVNCGVFRSADGLRQFRMDPDSIQGNTGPTFHTYTSRFSPSPEQEGGGEQSCAPDPVMSISTMHVGFPERLKMIKIDRVGKITAGDELGRFVRINELPDNPPSYLILLADDSEFSNGCGDYWVENREDLDDFFAEAHWEVEWSHQ